MSRFSTLTSYLLVLLVSNALASISSTTLNEMNAMLLASSTASGIISTVAGNFTYLGGSTADGIAAIGARLDYPRSVVIDKNGNLLISEGDADRIRLITTSTGIITTVAGTGVSGFGGDGGQATSAKLNDPRGLDVDKFGNIFIADSGNNLIRKIIVSTGVISTLAGNREYGYNGDNIAATSASLCDPNDVAVDTSGNIFIADRSNKRVRKVTASTGIITTIAGGNLGSFWVRDISNQNVFSPAGVIATAYTLGSPVGVTLDASGNVFIAGGSVDRVVYKLTVSTGNISVAAGSGNGGYSDDNILATRVFLDTPWKVAFDATGNMFISERKLLGWNPTGKIRKVTASTGIMTTVAGSGDDALGGWRYEDQTSWRYKEIVSPNGITVDPLGNFYFCDAFLHVVRKVTYPAITITPLPSTSVTPAPSVKPTPSFSMAPTSSASLLFIPTAAPSSFTSMAPTSSASSSSSPVLVIILLLISLLVLHLHLGI